MTSVRANAVEGLFYTGDPRKLKESISAYLSAWEKTTAERVKFIIAPHAGYAYSGNIAGAAYSEVSPDRYDHVILLGPSHRHYFEGIAESIEDRWQTPLGPLEIKHLDDPNIIRSATYHRKEHCLEVQLPFIKYLLPQARLSPLLLSGDRSQAGALAGHLLPFDSDRTLWIISSDFNHTGPNFQHIPESVGYTSGKQMDEEAIHFIVAGDIPGLTAFLQKTRSTICGALPILVAMHLARMMNRPGFTFKAYDCSGDQTGDINSVGYGALYC